ncbi:MAG TPA: hypothetical protein VKV02_08755 [Acidobacteriaceae bacterium]|nr:hypothetical protein [Acidobacteriaceae bacterium]
MNWTVGEAFQPKQPLTTAALVCGIGLESRGHITHIGPSGISFLIGAGGYALEAVCPSDVFSLNFRAIPYAPVNLAYRASRPFTSKFPDDFRR